MRDSPPLFSVVIPVYNRANTVLRALRSVQEQTFRDFECIVVDDGSQDGDQLRDVVDSLEDPRFRYLWRENGGGGAARNTGVEASSGRFVCFLDSDDRFLPSKLSVVERSLTSDGDVVLYSQALVDRGVGAFWPRPSRALSEDEDVGEFMFVHNQFIQTSTLVLPRQVALAVPFDPGLRKGQDLDLCLRLQAAGSRFRMIPEPLTIWHDVTEEGRTSRDAGYDNELSWLSRSRGLLTTRAFHGYRATVLAYHMAGARPFAAAWYLLLGVLRGGVSLATTARQFLRCYLPRGAYRWLTDRFVARAGRDASPSAGAT